MSIGRSSKTVREFLEKNYPEELSRSEAIKLTIKSLLEVVQTGAKNIEISVMEKYGVVTVSLPTTSGGLDLHLADSWTRDGNERKRGCQRDCVRVSRYCRAWDTD